MNCQQHMLFDGDVAEIFVHKDEHGVWVVQIDTPGVTEDDDGPLMRVHLNEARLHPAEAANDDATNDRHALAERLADVEMRLDEVEGERATLAEQLHAAEEELRALRRTVGVFCDWATRRWLVRGAELRRRALALVAAIRSGS